MNNVIDISSIVVEDRQRQDLGDLDSDFSSIKEVGLIQPIIVEKSTTGFRLVAGGRRLAWLTKNGFTKLYHGITCTPDKPGYVLSGELSPLFKQEAELYENIKRQNLSWKEECRAIAKIHRMRWIHNKAEALAWGQRHTARLLGIKDNAKVSYALQIADELSRDPNGELSKCENYIAAVRLLIQRTESEARKDQDRRRALVETETTSTPPAEDAPPEEQQKVTVWVSHMVYHADFPAFAKDEFGSEMVSTVLCFGVSTEWGKQAERLLKKDGVLIWAHGISRDALHTLPMPKKLHYIGYPIYWNILDEAPDELYPFRYSLFEISVFIKGEPQYPAPSPVCIVSAPDNHDIIPPAVIDFLLHAVSIPGDTILMPTGGPVASVCLLGRRPVAITPDKTKVEEYTTAIKEYYSNQYNGNVIFK